MAGRFFTGLHSGLATQIAPMYLLKIASCNLKGAIGTANQLLTTIGIFVSLILGLSHLFGTEVSWPYLLLINAIPCTLCLVFLPFLPDSPRYLMLIKRNRKAAEKALRFLRAKSDVLADLEEMESELSHKEQSNAVIGKSSDGGRGQEREEEFTMKQLLTTKELQK